MPSQVKSGQAEAHRLEVWRRDVLLFDLDARALRNQLGELRQTTTSRHVKPWRVTSSHIRSSLTAAWMISCEYDDVAV
jgi:hypothetical protein